MTEIDSIIKGLDQMIIHPTCESYTDIYQFFTNADVFLPILHRSSPDELYTKPLSMGGNIYLSIEKACQELNRVNAYMESLTIYNAFLQKLEEIKKELDGEERLNVQMSIDGIQESILKTMQLRDQYTSKRKEILAKYSTVIDKLK